ncbi:helix-turn-helix transcriptional regulator [Neorhizobium sp. T786]|uniref:helix-turn-helix domain-containing protein n=1 Tax=Pseudorhizobium xiangyangii TaxID=2883104 RepID=UPI001CFFE5BF|nr:helix-turn-helix transcriptional regulator [Neorhizobium xiangyangii]MCB5203902.1 helix-turn-helix transcriptional regulator [Neorhizobium xiangyangii]
MEKTLHSTMHAALVALLIQKRKASGITQEQLATAIGEHQSFVARLESGQRRLDVVEYAIIARAIGFDAAKELRALINGMSN